MAKESKKIVVFGATGGIGGHVVRQALDAEHRVTAVVRDTARFDLRHPGLDMIRVPGLADPAVLVPALRGSDAVVSGVGARGPQDGPVASTSTRGILAAMKIAGARRFVAVSAVPVGPTPEDESFLNRRILLPLVGRLLRDVYADLTAMEHEIARSGTEWTIVRPPRLVNGQLTGTYRRRVGGNVPRGYLISRANVAHAMLGALSDPSTIKQAVGVAN